MALIKFKPTTPTRRHGSGSDFSEITASEPYKPLTIIKKGTGGRNSYGHITSYWRGSGHKRRIRIVDFKRAKHGVDAEVKTIEYDPNRTCRIALIEYADHEKSYILASEGLKVGHKVSSGPNSEVQTGNHLPLRNIPEGTPVHNIELEPGRGGKLVRTAGGLARIMSKEDEYAHLKLPSGEVRMIKLDSYATVGQCSNIEHENVVLGKAGRSRWLGKRPHVRGVAMNPVDHPLGGGEGKTSGGRHPVSAWGQKSKGLKTRKRNKTTSKYVVRDRRA
ncbi:MAG: 50S ribosomal protein L2 [Omnitrophica bacterium RIFCSPLOWO2_12_FULL_44_17]|uniref:Large ribosomal subunit protein uL2 n=1 Tax=Candidatus Danuiimicrobium aquiferis TaxID=1801832 RepID=A0A1G1KZZ3_9BACT|nr:MAG: 50S ribosomal protein L2 [Omnitrophica bacterium RIFCSPHIGHO2_02_FULL_45_28]OGW91764.1 MAG: 50S ribosomal protein L2 [Omnitrophica bacterium RIFCSPHIGHO2_12_FULL_44_12]OGW98468.1 MAG: 50S ribosomal protein L2 [Omnitrophica bacterium RIFCSPLOWO2_12_FULL_44_17]OGX02915.1 MAG: 50S ribosomal protein L2 [Omnitrophica bacterium RIFCSPLOWO2_02_FULL_44_11]